MKKRKRNLFNDNIPSGYECPITRTIMEDPVVTADGHSYERKAIQQWFQAHNTGPMTGALLPHTSLIPNHNLRKAIENFPKILENIQKQEEALKAKEIELRDKENELCRQETEHLTKKKALEDSVRRFLGTLGKSKEELDEVKSVSPKKQVIVTPDSSDFSKHQRALVSYREGERYFFLGNFAMALFFLHEAADLGYPPAFLRLGHIYLGNECCSPDQEKSKTYYQMASAQLHWFQSSADKNDADGQYYLGICYENGIGVQENADQAVKWYQLAAGQGHLFAQFHLMRCYKNGKGVSKDVKEAMRLCTQLSSQKLPVAQFHLAMFYACGTGVEKDKSESARWFRMAADQGHVHAKFELGMYYEEGIGVLKDEKEAVRWYLLAAESGHFRALLRLAQCHELGVGVPEDHTQALYWRREYERRTQGEDASVLLLAQQPVLESRSSSLVGAQHRLFSLPDAELDQPQNPSQSSAFAQYGS